MPQEPLAISPDKIELMATAFRPHRLDVVDGVSAGDVRGEFGEQMSFGSRTLEHPVTREQHFLKHRSLQGYREMDGVPPRMTKSYCRIKRLLVGHNSSFGSFWHVGSKGSASGRTNMISCANLALI
jgi:hypothetical protein